MRSRQNWRSGKRRSSRHEWVVRTSPRRDVRYGTSTTRRRKSATRRSTSLKKRVKSKFKLAKSKSRLATTSNRKARAYRSSASTSTYGVTTRNGAIRKGRVLGNEVVNTEGLIENIATLMLQGADNFTVLDSLRLLNKNSYHCIKAFIQEVVNTVIRILNTRCAETDYEEGIQLIHSYSYTIFRMILNSRQSSTESLGELDKLQLQLIHNLNQHDEEYVKKNMYRETGIRNDVLDTQHDSTEHNEAIDQLLYHENKLKVATYATLYRAKANRRTCRFYMFEVSYFSSSYCGQEFQTMSANVHTPQMRYVGIARIMCDVLNEYENVNITFRVFFRANSEFDHFQLTPFQQYIVTFLKNQTQIKYRITLIFMLSESIPLNLSNQMISLEFKQSELSNLNSPKQYFVKTSTPPPDNFTTMQP